MDLSKVHMRYGDAAGVRAFRLDEVARDRPHLRRSISGPPFRRFMLITPHHPPHGRVREEQCRMVLDEGALRIFLEEHFEINAGTELTLADVCELYAVIGVELVELISPNP